MVIEGDHLSATWLIIERFRDYVTQRLLGDFVVAVPNRNRLTAIRADEPGLIGQIQQSSAVVMHIQIDGDQIGGSDLYWRGVALTRFDGAPWRWICQSLTKP